MEWLIIGAVLAVGGLRLAAWARARSIHVHWDAWVLAALAVLLAALTAMDYGTFTAGLEPGAANVILWFFGAPAGVLALLAAGLVWLDNRKTGRGRTEN